MTTDDTAPTPHALSRRVSSNQQGLHPGLPRLVARHLQHPWQEPAAAGDVSALQALDAALSAAPLRPLILDSFCGTGHSTRELAARFPGHLVIGVDKSAHRLARHGERGRENYLLLQARCEPVWRQLLVRRQYPQRHYLLYPNPWPKAAHLKRRVHGHPAFATLLALGGRLELRCNWQLYAEEFGLALTLAGGVPTVQQVPPGPPLSLFERKYRNSGHTLWRCLCTLAPGPYPGGDGGGL